jgi:hypothetical protein
LLVRSSLHHLEVGAVIKRGMPAASQQGFAQRAAIPGRYSRHMDAKTPCIEAVPRYADLISEESRLRTYANSVQANDRPEAIKQGPAIAAAQAQTDRYAGTAGEACPKGTSFQELVDSSKLFGALQGRYQAYGHMANKVTPAHPDKAYTLNVQKNYQSTVTAAGGRRWNAINAIARQPVSTNTGIVPSHLMPHRPEEHGPNDGLSHTF